MSNFTQFLTEARDATGLTRHDFSHAIGISTSTIMLVEKGYPVSRKTEMKARHAIFVLLRERAQRIAKLVTSAA